ncbi:excalibur calcium-binding domain-containing protein, partial [Streptomyces sp. NPDC057543]
AWGGASRFRRPLFDAVDTARYRQYDLHEAARPHLDRDGDGIGCEWG